VKAISRLLLTSLIAPAFCASAFDSADRKLLLDHLNRSSSEFLQSIRGLSPEQWSYKPAPDVWSVAECAEHIILSEGLIRDTIANKILNGPVRDSRLPGESKPTDKQVVDMVTDRSFKVKAPEPLQPQRKFATPEAAAGAFQEARAKTIALAKSRDDLRAHVGPHPVLKELDGHQWLLYLSGHTMRHTAQIAEAKAARGYPPSH
jgi:hypothetical protein